jgi:hypothetical protein
MFRICQVSSPICSRESSIARYYMLDGLQDAKIISICRALTSFRCCQTEIRLGFVSKRSKESVPGLINPVRFAGELCHFLVLTAR